MSENLNELSPNTLENISPMIRHSPEPLSPRSIIDQIARNLAESTQSLNPIPSIISHQPCSNTSSNSEASSRQNNRERPRNSQCIDLTKEQDDVMIITDTQNPVTRRNARRNNTSRTSTTTSTDEIEIISSQRRHSRRRVRNPNETIIIDDDRNEASGANSGIDSSTRSTDTELFSPSKRLKVAPNSANANTDSDDEVLGIPKCPLCLENLNELKQHNKKLVATPCGHVLCNKCLDEYIKSGGPQNKAVLCPTCRTKITKSKIITLFL